MAFHTPTLKLLSSSVLIAISGVFRLRIASLFLGISPGIFIYLAVFLIIYATYTFDRTLESKEDKINKKELISSRKDIALALCLISLATGCLILSLENLLLIALLPVIIGYIYGKGLRIGQRVLKLKGNFGMKNLTVSITWGIFLSGIVQHWADSSYIVPLFILPFITVKSFINTVIWDFRDVKGDAAAGIKTLPIYLGEKKASRLLQVMHVVLHLWMAAGIYMNLINTEWTIIFTLALAGMINTILYTKPSTGNESRSWKTTRNILMHGEFILAVVLREVTHF
ncbi:1,4-dihydroxy-2-naphthoate octaprenyltransferase [uncultured archaeon]|nr:1,4-dihydroxy-2-naphthoate octaprenyltransferase [uncultured archaeon]